MMPQKKAIRGLYAVTPDTADTAVLQRLTAAALKGGARIVQYRNKTASPALRGEQARALLDICNQHDAILLINDHVDLAAEIHAHGAHIGGEDDSLELARKRLGKNRIIGVSCYKELARASGGRGRRRLHRIWQLLCIERKTFRRPRAVVSSDSCARARSTDRCDRRHHTGQCGRIDCGRGRRRCRNIGALCGTGCYRGRTGFLSFV